MTLWSLGRQWRTETGFGPTEATTDSQEEILHPRTHETDRGFRLPRPPGVTTNASTNNTHEPKGPRSSIAPRLPGPEGPLLELDDRALDLPGIPHHGRLAELLRVVGDE